MNNESEMVRYLKHMGFEVQIASDWGDSDTIGKRVIIGTIDPARLDVELLEMVESFREFSAPDHGYTTRVHDDDPDFYDIAVIPNV